MDDRPNDPTRVWLVRTIDPNGCQYLKGVFGSFERAEAYVVEYHMTGHPWGGGPYRADKGAWDCGGPDCTYAIDEILIV